MAAEEVQPTAQLAPIAIHCETPRVSEASLGGGLLTAVLPPLSIHCKTVYKVLHITLCSWSEGIPDRCLGSAIGLELGLALSSLLELGLGLPLELNQGLELGLVYVRVMVR